MSKPTLTPQFVKYIPDRLESGILYISLDFATASHKCACGCGAEAVTPLAPTGWKLSFDGTVSLDPSIGMWSFPCRSHYWIEQNTIVWAPRWSKEQVKAGRDYDALERRRYFEERKWDAEGEGAETDRPRSSFWKRIKQKLLDRLKQ
jgi:hypothetical protein